MTLQEASKCLNLKIETLNFYENNGLLKGAKSDDDSTDYQETELRRTIQFHFLLKAGMDLNTLKHLITLMNAKSNTDADQVRILRKCRYQLLEEIHEKQQLLDQVDYLIHEINGRKVKGG
ncbi:MerR family transcriptional regulator [Solibaculum mannosilyticum]|uniref:HTH merR-type domain-containing protein n=1 Tax=Solibaculum mannosilyticum TaxID=2780922 RepID=A0A7I8D1W7_9FIRM|nr:MerR family transcriptional regulator [Solibaculum mannosilyticum]BCI60807.1 hypothetical protein C12CBH8_14460 [Solibaculum mannosilyticum]